MEYEFNSLKEIYDHVFEYISGLDFEYYDSEGFLGPDIGSNDIGERINPELDEEEVDEIIEKAVGDAGDKLDAAHEKEVQEQISLELENREKYNKWVNEVVQKIREKFPEISKSEAKTTNTVYVWHEFPDFNIRISDHGSKLEREKADLELIWPETDWDYQSARYGGDLRPTKPSEDWEEDLEDLFKRVTMKVESNLLTALKKVVSKDENSLPQWVKDEIRRYNRDAGKKLSPGVDEELEKFRPTKPITLYRGLGLHKVDAAGFLRKNKFKSSSVGSKGVYSTGKTQSWTSDKKQAEEFAGLHTIVGRDPDSLGIILKATVNPESIAAPLGSLPENLRKEVLHFDQAEYILKPGKYPAEIAETFGDWENSNVDVSKALKKVGKELGERLNAKVTKTWNKAPGFSLRFLDFGEEKWLPSFQISVDGLVIKFRMFGPGSLEYSPKKFESLGDLNSFVENELFNLVLKYFENTLGLWLETGKKVDWNHEKMRRWAKSRALELGKEANKTQGGKEQNLREEPVEDDLLKALAKISK